MFALRSHNNQEINSERFLVNSSIDKIYITVLLLIIIVTYLLLTYLSETWIFNKDFIYRSLSTEVPLHSIEGVMETKEMYWWASYLIQIVVFFCKVLFVSLCIFIGIVLSDIEFSFKDLFRSVIIAEFTFIIAQVIYLANLYVNRAELTFDTMANYFPISVLSFYGEENVFPWLHYPLQTLNLFEVAYILCISWLLSKQWKPDFIESINIVLPSYGIGLLIWMVLVVFLTLQIN